MKTILKWLAVAATVLLSACLVGAALVYASSNRHANHVYHVGSSWVAVPADAAARARGDHLLHAITKCADCHGANLGGGPLINDAAFGYVAAPNITRGRGGRLPAYSDQELARLIQHGVKVDGRSVIIMPAEAYTYLSDEDVAAIIAYLRTVSPVDSQWPAPRLGPLARALIGTGAIKAYTAERVDHDRPATPPIPADTTIEYGHYLADIGGCTGCHNPALSGGKIPNGDPASPPAANLTRGGSGALPESLFVRALREGKFMGSGQPIRGEYMPWKSSGLMTNAEIHAVWMFIQSMPAKETGQQ